MNTNLSQLIRRTHLLAGAAVSLAGVSLFAADAASPGKPNPNSDAFTTFDSYIKFSGKSAAITGNEAAFQQRLRQPQNGGAGLEDLHLSKDLTTDINLTLDGRALVGAEDYLGQFRLTKNEVGSFEAGYKRFRTFYDGIGGFFPLNNQLISLASQDLHTDRAKFWVSGTLNLPDMPVLTLHYTNELRSGQKDSTIWGDTDLTGLPFNLAPNPISPVRKIAPSYIELNERHELLEASLKHTIGKTTVQLTVLNDLVDNLDTRYVTRFPGEATPWSIASLSNTANATTGRSPQGTAKAAASPTTWNNQVALQQSDGIETTTTAAIGKIDTVINDKLTFRVGGSYQLLHSTFTGDRPLVTSTPTSTGPVQVTTATFTNLTGGSRIKVYTGNIALDYTPTPDLFIKVAFRAEDEYIKGHSTYDVIAASGTPATTVTSTPRKTWAKVNQHSATPVLETRYTGIKNLSLYFTGSQRDLGGEEKNTSAHNPLTSLNGTLANNNLAQDNGNYTLGANWRACSALTLRAEVFDKHHQFESTGFERNLGDYYLVDSQTQGLKLTAVVKPLPELSFTTRYVTQRGEMQVTGFLPTFPAYDSGDVKNHNISETIDWAPSKSFYLQLNGTLAYNVISTVYPRAGVTPATATNTSFDSNRVLQNSDNNYVSGNAIVGFVAGKDTDLQIQYTYYKSTNDNSVLAALTQPYGADGRDSLITLGIKHRFSEKVMVEAKVGYIDSKNISTGAATNFRGPLAYVSMSYAL